MEERGTRSSLTAAALLTASAALSFFALKLLGIICWILPIIGLLLPMLALPPLWGGALLLSAGGIAVSAPEARRAGARRWVFLLLIGINGGIITVILLVLAYFFGLIPRSLSWLYSFCAGAGGWFFHLP